MESAKVDAEQGEVTPGAMGNLFWFVPKDKARIMRRGSTMRAPYGLEIIESCLSCPYREDRLFSNLPPWR